MYNFKIIDQENIDWKAIENCYDHNVFKSKEWISYLKNYHHILPFIMEIYDNESHIGFFIGAKFKKVVTIIASPFEGWQTSFQGCSFFQEISSTQRVDIYQDLIDFIFKNKLCSYIQISDWELDVQDVINRKIKFKTIRGYYIDLRKPETELLNNMYRSTKKRIKKSLREDFSDFKISQPKDLMSFAERHYLQLIDVFKKQGLKPTHNLALIKGAISALSIANKVVAYEAKKDEKSIASCYRFYDGKYGFAIAASSYREYQHIYPNESLYFKALIDLKEKGVQIFELGGGRAYKEKYGPVPYAKPCLIASKYKILLILKDIAKDIYYGFRNLKSAMIIKKRHE